MFLKSEVLDGVFNDFFTLFTWDALDHGVVPEMFLNSGVVKDQILLWTISEQLAGLLKLLENVEAGNFDLSLSGDNLTR